ncbi:DUF1653 domain-containing protein [Eubacteriaceae bacterium ES3]|nr:DUF1653 domain-containing protein [Eubacteriaceae bacterium ES3]
MIKIKKGKYRHYKGKDYEVLDTAIHSESLQEMVVYKPLYGEKKTWVRPAVMWNQMIEKDGEKIMRFTLIEEVEDENRE